MKNDLKDLLKKVKNLESRTQKISYDLTKKEIRLYFSNYHYFEKDQDKINQCGELAVLAFNSIFENVWNQYFKIFISCIVIFIAASFSTHFWDLSFVFSLIIFFISIIFIRERNDALYERFIKGEEISVKDKRNKTIISIDHIAKQMVENERSSDGISSK